MIEAHYSTDTKVKRPKIISVAAPNILPAKSSFSDKEAKRKLDSINTDIYENTRKEKAKHESNKSLYFKIFGGVTLLTAGIAGISKIRDFFKR